MQTATAELQGQVYVVADPDTNSLLVATATKYQERVKEIIASNGALHEPALAAIRAAAGPGPVRVMICGTLYLAGWVLAENG